MFNKKEFENITSSFEELRLRLDKVEDQLNSKFSSLENKDVSTPILNKITELEQRQLSFKEDFDQEISELSELNELFRKRVEGFRILEDRASRKLIEEASLEIKGKLEGLSQSFKRYQSLEVSLDTVRKRLDLIGSEVEKFSTIAKEIKAADFQLANFARKVTQEDTEKLRLMRENEKLKMLIASERRRRN